MKSNRDVGLGWLRKAQSDLTNARLCLDASQALDTACFHCQQAAEKSLKAYLIANGVAFPFIHDVGKLLELCGQRDPTFMGLLEKGLSLNPFAVAMRYDEEFWPERSVVASAIVVAEEIAGLVAEKLEADGERM